MYLNPPTNGRYELAEPRSVDDTKWYIRTFAYQFSPWSQWGQFIAPNRYAYLNRDLSFVMHPNQDFYATKDEALDVMRLYQIKCDQDQRNQTVAQPQEKVYKLLEPRLSLDRQDQWLVPAADEKHYLFSNDKIVHHLYITTNKFAYFPSYQSALFAKLRYERLNREK